MPKLKQEKKSSGESAESPRGIVPRERKRPLLLALAVVLITGWLVFLAVLALGGY
jgi:hypothetical protein